jgi:high-affinity Fe2+/Pb2+ permease
MASICVRRRFGNGIGADAERYLGKWFLTGVSRMRIIFGFVIGSACLIGCVIFAVLQYLSQQWLFAILATIAVVGLAVLLASVSARHRSKNWVHIQRQSHHHLPAWNGDDV